MAADNKINCENYFPQKAKFSTMKYLCCTVGGTLLLDLFTSDDLASSHLALHYD